MLRSTGQFCRLQARNPEPQIIDIQFYNDQLNAQVFYLFYSSIYFCLTCFGLSFSPCSEAGVQLRQWFKSPGYGVSVPGDGNRLLIDTA
jgi:hypothetical protein